MKIWPVKVRVPVFGVCEVREMTDKECHRDSSNKTAPSSHGFCNLFQEGIRVGFCGIAYAKRRIINKKAKLPKYIRDIKI